ncbi:MAG TPA: hypothetical protein VEA18_04005 [Candidatus Kapabacteria bacterium]|nr:hypothetical protein [Candidatus Kapabacteria bacterium]
MKAHTPSLILVTNTHHAVWYIQYDDRIERCGEMIEEKAHYSDNEGFFRTRSPRGTIRAGGPDLGNGERAHETHEHILQVARKTAELKQQEDFIHYVVIAPDTMKNSIREALEKEAQIKEILHIPGNHVHDQAEAIERLFRNTLQTPVLRTKLGVNHR